jgi:hypothetical protein
MQVGTYYFRAVYSGDAIYNGSTSGDTEEPLEVIQCFYDDTAWAFGGGVPGVTAYANWDFVKSNNWGWTNKITTPGTYVLPLYAGAGGNDISKGLLVGEVTIEYTGTAVMVTYDTTGGAWLSEVHLWVGSTQLPQVTQGKKTVMTDAPGRFPYGTSVELDPGTTTWSSGWIPATGTIYVAAHAVAMIPCQPVLPPPCDLTGAWDLVFNIGGEYAHDMVITVHDAGGNLTGTGGYPASGPYTHEWVLTGTVVGNNVNITITYLTENPGYQVFMTGVVSNCDAMAGTMTTSALQSGTWAAFRATP